MNIQNYIYIIIYDNAISSLGFDSFDKAEQWLFAERKCSRLGNDWIYIDDNSLKYCIKEIMIK
jgi:hypothetical protein